jgi:hypothetical protein
MSGLRSLTAARPRPQGRQHGRSPASSFAAKRAATAQASLRPLSDGRQFLAIVQRHRDAVLGRDEQIVFQQVAREQQPMPLVVGKLLDEVLDLVRRWASCSALTIAQLLAPGRAACAEVAPRFVHVSVGSGSCTANASSALRAPPSAIVRACLIALSSWRRRDAGKAAHRITGPFLSFSSTCAHAGEPLVQFHRLRLDGRTRQAARRWAFGFQ